MLYMWNEKDYMKTSMERSLPIIRDVQEQADAFPNREFVFFYDDGSIFRAFLVDSVFVDGEVVTAVANNKSVVQVPKETSWRLVHKDYLEYITGGVLEQMELIGIKQKQELKEKMIKKLGWDVDAQGKVTKKKKKDGDEKAPGVYL